MMTLSASPPYFTAQRRGDARPVFDWSAMMNAPSQSPAWSPAEAFLALLILAAVCDHEIRPAEQETLTAIVHRSHALKALDERALAELNTRVMRRLENEGDSALQSVCEALPTDLRLPTFALALDLLLADGDIAQPEAAFLNAIVAHLRLAEDDVQRVAEVLILKNRA